MNSGDRQRLLCNEPSTKYAPFRGTELVMHSPRAEWVKWRVYKYNDFAGGVYIAWSKLHIAVGRRTLCGVNLSSKDQDEVIISPVYSIRSCQNCRRSLNR